MNAWPATKPQRVPAALDRTGWPQKRRSGAHLCRPAPVRPTSFSPFTTAAKRDEPGPRMLARIAKATGLRPQVL